MEIEPFELVRKTLWYFYCQSKAEEAGSQLIGYGGTEFQWQKSNTLVHLL